MINRGLVFTNCFMKLIKKIALIHHQNKLITKTIHSFFKALRPSEAFDFFFVVTYLVKRCCTSQFLNWVHNLANLVNLSFIL